MNCKDCKQALPSMAGNDFDAPEYLEIRYHLRGCGDCAKRWKQLQRVATSYSDAAREIQALPIRWPASVRRIVQPSMSRRRRAIWRWMLPVAGVVTVAMALFFWREPTRTQLVQSPRTPVTAPTRGVDLHAPSMAAYRNAIGKSGDASLDALLALDAQRLLPKTEDRAMRDELF